MLPTISDLLDDETAEEVCNRLQATMTEALHLALVAKQWHWTVTGPQFLALHEQLDQVAADAHSWVDQLAERIATLGTAPQGWPSTVAALDGRTPDDGLARDREVVNEMEQLLRTRAASWRDRIGGLDELDVVSADLLTGLLAELELHLWFFDAQQ